MNDRLINRLAMYRKKKAHLEKPENKAVWHNQPPTIFTTRASELYAMIDQFGEMDDEQSVGTSGASQQQNAAEIELEDAAHSLAGALHEYYLDHAEIANAATWDMSLTAWRRLREQALLDRAKALRTAATPLSTGSPAPGTAYGITAAKMTDFSAAVDKFGEEIGKPGQHRAERKAMTREAAPGLSRKIREKLRSMDKLIPQFGGTASGDAFVAGWFAIGIDDLPGVLNPANPPASPVSP